MGRGIGASSPVSAIEARRSRSAVVAPIVRGMWSKERWSAEIVGARKGSLAGGRGPLTLNHVLDSLRLEGNVLGHLELLGLRGHEGDEFVAHRECVLCVYLKTKEETSGWNHPRCVKWRGAAVDVDICAVVFAFQVCTRANLGEFDGTGRLARSLNLTPGNFF